jgi:HD superfamily phosphohydrolase YqeK
MCPLEILPASSSTLNTSAFVPPSATSNAVYDHAYSLLHPAILNHSIRTYLYASALAESRGSIYHTDPSKKDLLFTACIMHDIGTTPTHNGPNRFEVEGADAAVKLLAKLGVSEEGRGEVWKAIALHTCDGIVQRMGELSNIVRKAVEIDFGKTEVEEIENLLALKAQFEELYARIGIEKILGDTVVEQCVRNPNKACPQASWSGVMYKSHLENPNWRGVNKAFGAVTVAQ